MTVTPVRRQSKNTATRVLDVAEALVQTRGYNGFSYADVAAELGITTASLHYHFPGKAELGSALIRRYSERFGEALVQIDRLHDGPAARLQAFAELYVEVLRRGRMCLCGMLAADYETLPQPMREAVTSFFDTTEAWLAGALEAGRDQGSLTFTGPSLEAARIIVSGLEGGMLIARPFGDVDRFKRSAALLLAGYGARPSE